MTKIIGLGGKSLSGKTTIGNYLSEILTDQGHSAKIYHFADVLKESCAVLFGFDPSLCYTEEGKGSELSISRGYFKFLADVEKYPELDLEKKLTIRELLQFIGTDLIRNNLNPDIWADTTIRKIQRENYDIALICDVRFPNELDVINKYGTSIRLTRTIKNDRHVSETALDNYVSSFTHVIRNHLQTETETKQESKTLILEKS